MKSKLSPTMVFAIEFAKERGGKLVRHQGGFWSDKGWNKDSGIEWFGAQTVESLVKRGYMRYSQNQYNKRGAFPVEAELVKQNQEG